MNSIAEKAVGALDVAIDVLEELQKTIGSGRPKLMRVRFGNKVIAELPLALTAGAAIAAGVVAVLLTKLAIDIDKDE